MQKPKIAETIIVEGRYDKNTLSQIVDAHIIETHGFGIFSDKELVEMIKQLAMHKGVIILTDGDGAGFVIRNYLKGVVANGKVINAYIPDILGKEKRKTQPSREGKLGVEGMSRDIIIKALRDAGATFEGETRENLSKWRVITKTDLYLAGLSGSPDSTSRRRELLVRLGLPEQISANSLLQALNSLYTYDEFISYVYPQDKQSQ